MNTQAEAKAMGRIFTTKQVADLYGVEPWRVRRLFELGILDEPARLGGKRIICQGLLVEIAVALRERGWLNRPVEVASK